MKFNAPKGTQDLLPDVTAAWQRVERKFADICRLYGYEEIRVPTFEHTEIFQRGVGDTTDIVQKEMYTFEDLGGRSMTLRPEGTAGVVRSFVENGMASKAFPVKLYYLITAFRYENVQKGRYREFHQLGVEAFGSEGPLIDAEIVAMLAHFFRELGLKQLDLQVNSIGCPSCRAEHKKALIDFLSPHKDELCADCRERLERNPLRVLDCKEESCRKVTEDAPVMLDYLDEGCKAHFEGFTEALDNLGVAYHINPRIVRGLDYYTRTVFEFVSENVGTQGTICGGGRYNGLVQELGGPEVPGIGFAMGEERLMIELEAQGVLPDERPVPRLFVASMDEASLKKAQQLVQRLRYRGIPAEYELCGRSMRAQMKQADRSGAEYLMVIGQNEREAGKANIRSLRERDKAEECFAFDDMEGLAERLRA